jgi:hypothetical protein
MNHYIVLYRIESIMCPEDAPFGFKCYADDGDHAEEQCLNAYPDADVVWVSDRLAMQDALADYWSTEED